MTFGTIALMALETAPIHPPVRNLAAVAPVAEAPAQVVYATEIPIQPLKWRNIVIHSTAGEPGVVGRCHFVVHPVASGMTEAVEATAFWKHQLESRHTNIPGRDYNTDSIGICLVGDFHRQQPPPGQLQMLIALVHVLQRQFNISADHIYLHSELDADSQSPGAAFPAERFTASLLRPDR
ncbi:MAG: peptidoglycan recognition family protein [Planctomycetota bacterium]|nr:peptidoglycan recognition family protein [Planctomycetota bacterium]